MEFKEIIKKLRYEYGLSQEELAKKIGVARSSVANYENGQNFPNKDILIKLSEIFKCSIDYLMGKTKFKTFNEQLDFIENYYHNNYNIPKDIIHNSLVPPTSLTPKELQVFKKIQSAPPLTNENKIELSTYLMELSESEQNHVLDAINNMTKCMATFFGAISAKNNATIDLVSIPIVGKIAAGQPILAQENIEGYLPLDPSIYGLSTSEDLFFLRVAGQSMNLKVKNGDYALIHKQNYAENGDIVVAIVNGDDEATLKRYKQLNEQFVLLEPMSTDTSIEPITVDLKNTEFHIIGKAIGQFGKF